MNKTFSFGKQLKIGEIGEQSFIKYYHDLNPRKSSIREVDIFINDNEKVELKSDNYLEEDTPNMFIELVGNTVSGKLGGPHLSKQNDVNWFVYHYSKNKTFYWFKVDELCEFIDKNQNNFEVKEIKNVAWSSIGILIPREKVSHLVKRKDIFK